MNGTKNSEWNSREENACIIEDDWITHTLLRTHVGGCCLRTADRFSGQNKQNDFYYSCKTSTEFCVVLFHSLVLCFCFDYSMIFIISKVDVVLFSEWVPHRVTRARDTHISFWFQFFLSSVRYQSSTWVITFYQCRRRRRRLIQWWQFTRTMNSIKRNHNGWCMATSEQQIYSVLRRPTQQIRHRRYNAFAFMASICQLVESGRQLRRFSSTRYK